MMKKNLIKITLVSSSLFFMACEGAEKETKVEEKSVVEEPVKEETTVEETVAENNTVKIGEALFTEKGCVACHQADEKVIGPSLKDVSAAYTENAEGMKAFLKEEGEAIVEPELFPTMQVNLAITKEMNDEDLGALIDFIMSH